MQNNNELFESVQDLIVHVKACLMKHTKLTVCNHVEEENSDVDNLPMPVSDTDHTEALAFEIESKKDTSTKESKELVEQLEEKLLSSLPTVKYNEVQKIIKELDLTSKDGGGVAVRTRYNIYKDIKTNINAFTVDIANIASVLDGFDEKMFDSSKNKDTALAQLTKIYTAIEDQQENTTTIHGASISMQCCYDAIIAKIERERVKYLRANKGTTLSMEKLLEDGYLVGVPDGAVHNALSNKNNGIVTYSIALVSHNLIKYLGISPLSATHIITQSQVNGPENRVVLYAVTKDRHNHFANVKQYGTTNLPFYDMADAKAIYTLLGHLHWKRKNRPFVGCACGRGDGSTEHHKCVAWTNEKYIENIKKSALRWSKREAIERLRKQPYTIENHKDWCDQKNDGICHFSVVPQDYKFASCTRYDVFHGRGNVAKKMITHIYNILNGNYTNLEHFALFLASLKSWGDYKISPWLTGDGVARLKGVHIKEFVKRTNDVTALLSSICLPHEVEHINAALKAYEKMSKILSFVFIDEYEAVKDFLQDSLLNGSSPKEQIANYMSETYKKYAKEFYNAGIKSFMTNAIVGDGETFYIHNLFFYMPSIIEDTYKKHKLGPGVWSMEGFEYKNAQSKQAVYTHSNCKGNLPAQSLAHLYLIYTMGQHIQQMDRKKKQTKMKIMQTIHENEDDNNDVVLEQV